MKMTMPNGEIVEVKMEISKARFGSGVPHDFRWAQYPDGTVRLQGAYKWRSEDDAGEEWKEFPTVRVDANGKQIPESS